MLLGAVYTKKKYGPLSQRVQFLAYKQLVYIKKHAKWGGRGKCLNLPGDQKSRVSPQFPA